MDFIPFSGVVFVFSVLGINMCLACDPTNIQLCVMPLKHVDRTQVKAVCSEVDKAIACLNREFEGCPPEMKNLVALAKKSLDLAHKACHDPEAAKKELSGIEDCDNALMQRCAQEMNQHKHSSERIQCSLLGKAKRCIANYTRGCKNEYMVEMVNSQNSVLDRAGEECKSKGYPVDDDNSNGRSGVDNSSGRRKDENSSGRRGDENSSGRKGDGNNSGETLQPAFFTLLASALLVSLRYFT